MVGVVLLSSLLFACGGSSNEGGESRVGAPGSSAGTAGVSAGGSAGVGGALQTSGGAGNAGAADSPLRDCASATISCFSARGTVAGRPFALDCDGEEVSAIVLTENTTLSMRTEWSANCRQGEQSVEVSATYQDPGPISQTLSATSPSDTFHVSTGSADATPRSPNFVSASLQGNSDPPVNQVARVVLAGHGKWSVPAMDCTNGFNEPCLDAEVDVSLGADFFH